MWIQSLIGFFSIVQKGDGDDRYGDGYLCVRARARADLEALRDRYLPELSEIADWAASDYRYRAWAPRDAVARAVAQLVQEIDYRNFKHAVWERNPARERVYEKVWADLYEIQEHEND